MKRRVLPPGALDVLLKEHSLIRDEIKERLKTAFSHVAYAGAIAAFAIPAANQVSEWVLKGVTLSVAAVGLAGLLWVTFLNMRWVRHAGAYVAAIERRVNEHFGEYTLGWEHYANYVRTKMWALIPASPKHDVAPIETILEQQR